MTARQRTKELSARKARIAAEAVSEPRPGVKKESRAARERDADVARGNPPEPSHSTRVPPALQPDLIMVWELLHVRFGPSPCICMQQRNS